MINLFLNNYLYLFLLTGLSGIFIALLFNWPRSTLCGLDSQKELELIKTIKIKI